MTKADPWHAAATARVEAALHGLRRVNLQVVVVALPDLPRLEARDRARELAAASGRADLLESSAAAARDVALRAFARGGFSGTWAATEMSASVANASDRIAAAAAFEEAAMAAVIEDVADGDTLDVLRETAADLDVAGRLPAPGALSGVTSPATLEPSPARAASGVLVVVAVMAWVLLGGGVGLALIVVAAAVALLARRRSAAS